MANADQLPNKHEVARTLLLKGTLFVHLDPRLETVMVPGWLKRQPQLVLQVGLDMPLPIPDLRVDEVGVYGTLSFSRTAFACLVPWEAVFALAGDDGRGMVWPGSMPDEIAAEVAREAGRARMRTIQPSADASTHEAPTETEPGGGDLAAMRRRSRPSLPGLSERTSASGSAAYGAPNASGDGRPAARKRRELPPYLRVVK